MHWDSCHAGGVQFKTTDDYAMAWTADHQQSLTMNWIRLMLHGAAHAWMPSICTKMVDGERLTQLEAYVFGAVTIYDNFMWRYIHSFHDNTLPDSVHASCVLPACRHARRHVPLTAPRMCAPALDWNAAPCSLVTCVLCAGDCTHSFSAGNICGQHCSPHFAVPSPLHHVCV